MTRGRDLALVRKSGTRFRGSTMELRLIVNETLASRVGIIVPRHAHSAVDRNRVKRRIREIVRVERIGAACAPAGGDVVLFALPSAYRATFQVLRADVLALAALALRGRASS